MPTFNLEAFLFFLSFLTQEQNNFNLSINPEEGLQFLHLHNDYDI